MARKAAQTHLKSEAKDFTKTYIVYDPTYYRMTHVYTAPADAVDGQECSVTEYVYDGTSSRIVKRREYEGSWISATMDI